MLTFRYLVAIVLLICCFVSFGQTNDDVMDITAKKWILVYHENNFAWKSVTVPAILNFERKKLITNFSNFGYDYKLSQNTLVIGKTMTLEIVQNEACKLVAKFQNLLLEYQSVTGDFDANAIDKFKSCIKDKAWNLNSNQLVFLDNTVEIRTPDGSPLIAGMYTANYYNGALIFSLILDNEKSNSVFSVISFNSESIELMKYSSSNEAITITRWK
jgi:hypothetical protein